MAIWRVCCATTVLRLRTSRSSFSSDWDGDDGEEEDEVVALSMVVVAADGCVCDKALVLGVALVEASVGVGVVDVSVKLPVVSGCTEEVRIISKRLSFYLVRIALARINIPEMGCGRPLLCVLLVPSCRSINQTPARWPRPW